MKNRDAKPKVGLIVSTLMKDEFNDFTATRPAALEKLGVLRTILGQMGDVISIGLMENIEDGKRTGQEFVKQDVDIIIYTALSYNKGIVAAQALLDNDIPLVVWNTQHSISLPGNATFDDMWTNSGLAGIPELCNTLLRADRHFELLTGHVKDPVARQKIKDFLNAALLRKQLKNSRIAMVGQVYGGMTDFMIDNFSLSQAIGPVALPVEPYAVAEEIEKVGKEAIELLVEDTKNRYKVNVNDELMEHSAALALAMDKVICERYKGDAVAILDQVWMKEPRIGIPPTFGYLYLNRKGVPCVNEVDTATAAALLILQFLSGKAAVVEFFDMDFKEGTVILCHDTNGNPALAREESDVSLTEAPLYAGVRGSGVACQFVYPKGDITLLSIAGLPSGWRLVVSEGQSIKVEPRAIGSPFLCFRPTDKGLDQFCDQWCRAGATHHMGFAYGKWSNHLKTLARFLGIEAVVV